MVVDDQRAGTGGAERGAGGGSDEVRAPIDVSKLETMEGVAFPTTTTAAAAAAAGEERIECRCGRMEGGQTKVLGIGPAVGGGETPATGAAWEGLEEEEAGNEGMGLFIARVYRKEGRERELGPCGGGGRDGRAGGEE